MARDGLRNYLMVLADGSGSMGPDYKGPGPQPILQLSEALGEFVTRDLPDIPAMASRGEVAIGLFRDYKGEVVDWQQLASGRSSGHPFYRIADGLVLPKLDARGQTPLVDACLLGIGALAQRRSDMAAFATEYKPIIVLITDGAPSEGQDVAKLSAVIGERAYKTGGSGAEFLFLAFGTAGANMDVLSAIAPKSTWDLRDKSIGECIRLVTESIKKSVDPVPNVPGGATYQGNRHNDYAALYAFLGDPYERMRA